MNILLKDSEGVLGQMKNPIADLIKVEEDGEKATKKKSGQRGP